MAVIDKGIWWNPTEIEICYQSLLSNKKILLTHPSRITILWRKQFRSKSFPPVLIHNIQRRVLVKIQQNSLRNPPSR